MHTTVSRGGLNKEVLTNACLQLTKNNKDKANKMSDFILDKRPTTTKTKLKRMKKRVTRKKK